MMPSPQMKRVALSALNGTRSKASRFHQQAGEKMGAQVAGQRVTAGDERFEGSFWGLGAQQLPEVSSPESAEAECGAMSQSLSSEDGVQALTLLELEAQLQVIFQWLAIALNPSDAAAAQQSHGDPDTLRQTALTNAGIGLLETLSELPLDQRQVRELFSDRFGTKPDGDMSALPQERDFPSGVEKEEEEEEEEEEAPKSTSGWDTAGGSRIRTTSSPSRSPSPCLGGDFEGLEQYQVPCDSLPLFASIAGGEVPKRILKECVIYPSKFPHLFQGVRQPWKGILLYGPPGTGKTELAKGIAGESGAAFLLLTPSTLLSKFMGESEKMMSRIFAYAKHLAEEHQAAIIFLDEVDSLTTSRGSDGDSQPGMRRLLAELLLQFNGLNSRHRVVVIAATNRIEDLDPALLRRFERRIEVGLPRQEDRAELVRIKMEGTPMDSGVDLGKVARGTTGYSGAELELMCREAAMYGVRELMERCGENPACDALELRPVTQDDFERACEALGPPISRSDEHVEGKKKVKRGREEGTAGDEEACQTQAKIGKGNILEAVTCTSSSIGIKLEAV